MERALAKLLSRRRSASGADGISLHPKLSKSPRSRSMTGPVAAAGQPEAFTLRYLGYSYIDDPRSTKDVHESVTAVRESSNASAKVVQLSFHKDSLVVLEGVEKLLLSPFHFVYHCAQDIKGSSCFGVAFGSGHYMKQCHVFQAKSEREATDLVQLLQKASKLSKSKKGHRPQDAINSPVQKRAPKFHHLPMRVGVFEEEEHNPLETKSLSSISRRDSRAASLGPSSTSSTGSQTSSLRSTSASEHAPILRLSSRLAPTPPQTKRTFFPSSGGRTTKRSDEFTRKEKMEQLCSAVDRLLENNSHLRLLSSKSHPAGSFQDVIHAIFDGNTRLVEGYIDSSRTVVDACDGDQNSLLHYATAVGNVDMVNLLCSKGASVDAAGWNECRPIHRAAAEGNTSVLQALFARGVMVNGTDLMRRTPLHMSAGNPEHLQSSWALIENGAQVMASDVLGVRPFDLYPELEKMQARRITSVCEIFTSSTLPNHRPISSSSTHSSASSPSRPSSQLAGHPAEVGVGGIPGGAVLDLLAGVDQVRIRSRRMLYAGKHRHSHPPLRHHRSFSNLEELKEDEEDEMARVQLLKCPSAFDLQSYHLQRVESDAAAAHSKLNEFMDTIKRLSAVNRAGAEEGEGWLDDRDDNDGNGLGTQQQQQQRKRSISDPNILCDAGGQGSAGGGTVVATFASTARPNHSSSSEAIVVLEPPLLTASSRRPDSVASRTSLVTLTECGKVVDGKRHRHSQSSDTEAGGNDSVIEALDSLVRDFNRLSMTLDPEKDAPSSPSFYPSVFPFVPTVDGGKVRRGLKDDQNRLSLPLRKEDKQRHGPAEARSGEEAGDGSVQPNPSAAPNPNNRGQLPEALLKTQEETSAIFDSLIAQIQEASDSVSPQSPVPKEGKPLLLPAPTTTTTTTTTPSAVGPADNPRGSPSGDNNLPSVEVIPSSPQGHHKRNKKYPSPLKINIRASQQQHDGTPPPATAAPVVQGGGVAGAGERRRKHSLPTIRMLGNSTDSASTQVSTSSSSTSLDTSFLYRLSSASGSSHDDPEAILALKTLVKMSSNKECVSTIASYVCLPKFSSKLLSMAQGPNTSPEVLAGVATLVQNLYEVGGAEGKKAALGSGMLDLTVKLLKNTRDPVPGTCLSILNSLLVSEDDNEYLKTIIRIPTQPLLAYLQPCGESDGDSGVDNTRLRSSSDAICQQQQQVSSAESSRPSSMTVAGTYLEVAKRGRGLSFNSEGSDSSSNRSLVSTNLQGQPVTYLEARRIVLKMLAIASNHSKMQHDLSTSHTISLLMGCLGDPFEENVTHGMICLANLAQNVECHPLLLQAKLVEKLGSAQFDSPRPRYHATRALVYLGQVDMVKMSLFEPNSFDVDSVLWSDESSSVRYARGATLEKLVELLTDNVSEMWGGFPLRPSSPPYQGDPSRPSPDQIMDFFLTTYQSFIHPLILLRLLVHRLHSMEPGAPFNWTTRYEKPATTSVVDTSPSSATSPSFEILPTHTKVMTFLVRWVETCGGDFRDNVHLQEQLGVLIQRLRLVRGPYGSYLYKLRSSLQAAGKHKDIGETGNSSSSNKGVLYENRKQTPHHEHLYELYRNMIVGGHLPVTLEKAIYLSALQLHIENGMQNLSESLSPPATNGSSTSLPRSRKTMKARHTLPPNYAKAKNISKRIYALVVEFEELSDRNAKHRYIEKCQQLPGCDCTFFSVRVPSAGRYIKGSIAKQLMGISNQRIVLLDEKSKELVCQYSLQDLRGLVTDKTDPCVFTLLIKDFSLKVQVESSTTAWEIQNMLEPSHEGGFPNGQDEIDEWNELDLHTFALEPAKGSPSSPSSVESGELVQEAAATSSAPPPDPNIVTTTTSLTNSNITNGHMEEGLSRENSDDNGPVSTPSLTTFCNCPPDPSLPRTMDLQNLKLKEVLKCTEEVARQMTLIDHAQLCKISALELLQKANMVPRPPSQRNSKVPSQNLQSSLSISSLEQSETAIEKLAFRFNQVGNWVAYCILQHSDLEERVTAIHQFILIAKQCLEYHNYSSVMAVVVAGLGSAPIRRLHKTWEGVSKYHIDLFKEMDSLLESGNNYKRYRDRLSTIPTPAVPYIGVFLKDLTFICDGNPDYLRGGLINIHKRRQVYSKVEEIKRLQRDVYNFQPVLELQNYFTQYRVTPDDELHALSHELEPKTVVHRRATRSRSSTNLSSTTPNFSFFKPSSKHLSSTVLRT